MIIFCICNIFFTYLCIIKFILKTKQKIITMKKQILSLAIVLTAVALIFSSCKKDDTNAPTVSIKGDGTITLDLGDTWDDLGATANDEEDGDITTDIVVTGTVNTDQVGEYTLTYKVTDKAGNEGSATRTVKVKADKLAGSYSCETFDGATSIGTYNCTPTASSTTYNQILISNFGGYGQNNQFTATVDGSTITIATKEFTADYQGTTYYIKIYAATGTYTKAGSIYKISSFQYTEDIRTSPTATPTTTVYTETWTKQ